MKDKILVVDDDEAVRYTLYEILDNAGYEVHCVDKAKEALEIFEKKDIHVFFIDLQLPGMNGVELCHEIRKSREMDFLCAMTGHSALYGLVQCRQAGFDDYFLKPFDIKNITNAAAYGVNKLKRWGIIRT